MPIKLNLIGEKVLVRPIDWKPSNLIVIPDVIKTGYAQEAEVVSTAPFRRHKKSGLEFPFQVKAGDRILHHPLHSENKITLDGEKFLILEEKDILGTLERTEA